MSKQLTSETSLAGTKRYPKIEAAIAQLAVHRHDHFRNQVIAFGVLIAICVIAVCLVSINSGRVDVVGAATCVVFFPFLLLSAMIFMPTIDTVSLDKGSARSSDGRYPEYDINRSPLHPDMVITNQYARVVSYLMSVRDRAIAYPVPSGASAWPVVIEEMARIRARLEDAAQKLEGIDGQATSDLGQAFIQEVFASVQNLDKRLDRMGSAITNYQSAMAFDEGTARDAALDLAARQISSRA